jgi:hypothetical protein
MTRWRNHCHGFCVSGTYPSGGTQEKTESWRRSWVMRLATSPSQKTGIEMPISEMIISSGSKIVPRRTAAATPMTMAPTIQRIAAPRTSENVTGAASTSWGITLLWYWYEIRSREMNRRFIISAY